MRTFSISTLIFCLLLTGCQTTSHAQEHADKPVLPQYKFKTRDNVQMEVDQAIARAKENNKLFLLVLGAEWCHDSRGLAQQFSTAPMQTILKNRFETVFVDVGYYKDLRELTTQFGYPGYFATPSVMVIDPETKQHLNMQSMAMWNSADSVATKDVLTYFSTVGLKEEDNKAVTIEQEKRRKQVQDFALKETARLFSGFEQLGPMIQALVNQTLTDDTQARALADEVYEFRMTLQRDIHRLHQQVEATATSSADSQALVLPTYGPFSWE